MSITKEVLEVEETLNQRISNILAFLNIKANIENGNIISLDNTNLAYIEPHKLIINNTIYLLFNESNEVFINTLEKSISITELQNHIKTHRIVGN